MGSSTRTRLTFIRHGSTAATVGLARLTGQFDVALSPQGRDEVQRLRRRLLIAPPFDAMYTSPLRRATETAMAISVAARGDLVVCRGLQEIDCGDVDGVLIDVLRSEHAALWEANLRGDDDRFRWPGGESYRDLRCRALRSLRIVERAHRGGHIALVTHAGVISEILGTIHGENASRWDLYRPGNASLTTIEWSRHSRVVLSFDDRSHLR